MEKPRWAVFRSRRRKGRTETVHIDRDDGRAEKAVTANIVTDTDTAAKAPAESGTESDA